MGPVNHVGGPARTSRLVVVHFSGVFDDVVKPESFFWGCFFVYFAFRVPEKKFFPFLLALNEFFGHLFAHEFGQVDIPFAIGEEGNPPLSFFFIPFGVVDDHFDLFWLHEHIQNGRKLLDLFFLVPYGVK